MKGEGFVTKFAPAERESHTVVNEQAARFLKFPVLNEVLKGIPEAVVILNHRRQIVYANQGVYRFLKPTVKAMGLRPGEAFQCMHALESWGGCGTTEFCRTCGSVRAILNCQQGKPDVQECHITRGIGLEPLDLRIWTTPLQIDGESFTVFAITDISDEKRRQVLERIFFHDVLNAAGGLYGYAEMLDEATPEQLSEFRAAILSLSRTVIEEIKTQRELLLAENGELMPEPASVDSVESVERVARSYRTHEAAKGKTIEVDSSAIRMELMTDSTLLHRVLGNMLKNALEATPETGRVTLGCRAHADGIEFWVHNSLFMPRSVQLQMFQRSFSTKGSGRGLGSYSMKLLTEHYLDGRVTFDTSLDDGTTFRVMLPLVLERPPLSV